MTMFTNFSEQFRKQDICLFTECIGDIAPFGFVSAATTGLGGTAFTNTNTDATSASQPNGWVAVNMTATANAVPAVYPRVGIYPAAGIPAGGAVNRDFRVGRGEIDLEVRVRGMSPLSVGGGATSITTVGVGSTSDTASTVATSFVGFFAWATDNSVWTAGIVVNSVLVRSVATTISSTNTWTVLRVVVNEKANRHKLYADGKLIATFDGQLDTTAGLLPHVEMADRTLANTGGSAARAFQVDYMMLKMKAQR